MGGEIERYPSGMRKRRGRKKVEDGGGVECTARAVADCVAVCCCPCAVVNFFTLTFLKLPWMVGRKCLGNLGKKKKKKKKKLKGEEKDGISKKEQGENGELGDVSTVGIGEEGGGSHKYSARFEAEKVWLEMYRVDNLGFGRVSFNGIHSLG